MFTAAVHFKLNITARCGPVLLVILYYLQAPTVGDPRVKRIYALSTAPLYETCMYLCTVLNYT